MSGAQLLMAAMIVFVVSTLISVTIESAYISEADGIYIAIEDEIDRLPDDELADVSTSTWAMATSGIGVITRTIPQITTFNYKFLNNPVGHMLRWILSMPLFLAVFFIVFTKVIIPFVQAIKFW